MKKICKKSGMSVPAAVTGVILFIILCFSLGTAPDRLIGAAFCHQLPSRSPAPDFPLCFRCAGLFSGIIWGILFSFLSKRSKNLFDKKVLAMLAAAFLLFMLDIVNTTEYIPIHWYEEKAAFRFLSSFPLGYMLVRLMAGIWLHFFDNFRTKEILPHFSGLPFFLITAAVSFLTVFSGNASVLHFFGYLLSAGSLIFLLILYSILIRCIALLKNAAWQDRTVLLSALLIVFLQICLLGGIHIRFLPSEVFEGIQ